MSELQALRFYFDPISPYAALAFWQLPEALAGHNVVVDYVPVLFGAMLKANGQKGPAEIETKRAWTYRQVLWLGREQGLALPAQHPFNPLALLRLAWACAPEGQTPSRWVVEQVLNHVWLGQGADANAPERLQALAERLGPRRSADEEMAKQRLRQATDSALAAGVFGVPTIEWQGKLFWGQDALPMLCAAMEGDPWFASGAWVDAGNHPAGVQRL
ncbi:2-hydroxychromene-2-carboxylate isomerase [Inhella inkyongensis]|uniref:2-hydroxychromene-2-carboxylate isomerase n=1 Tax=Inhella inkyongensis TaxID=392593 RepID=A0A840SAQ2_9BURK|nr:2-hydroxychromene-2-carboxylate isomerase [Inhella inkyongensis]MBB5206096.1 2-hydroxychromene-2-carboxylate isomerase [Inhella inkyongensis]